MSKNILILSGSPRKKGDSDLLIQEECLILGIIKRAAHPALYYDMIDFCIVIVI